MTLYAAVDLKERKLLCVSDIADTALLAAAGDERIVLSTSDIRLSRVAQAEISMSYEEDCVKETVCTILKGKGVDEDAHPAELERLAANIASDAYRNMMKFDLSEDDAICEAMKDREKEISALLAE